VYPSLFVLVIILNGNINRIILQFFYFDSWNKTMDTFLLINMDIPPCGSGNIRIYTEDGAEED
jgi:hypothetical protein